jgi:hypothetical protein
MLRLFRLTLLTAAVGAVLSQPAQAGRILGLPETLTTPHFQIHWDGFPPPPASDVTWQQAGDLAANFERAYSTYTVDLGYPAPLDDGDGKIDVYITDLMTPAGPLGAAFPATAANQTAGYIWIDDDVTELANVAAHELFHLVQFGIWAPTSAWLLEGTAEWNGFRFLGFPASLSDGFDKTYPLTDTLGMPDMSLSCVGTACGLDDYERGGYSRWPFYEYLSERFGPGVVKDIFLKAKALNDTGLTGSDFLYYTLIDKGSTLADVFTDWTVANMNGNYTVASLKGIGPPVYSSTATGDATAVLPAQKVAVNHLAARYLAFTRGSGESSGPCYEATLSLTVSWPTGLGARPYFLWTAPSTAPPAADGTPAPLTLPTPLAVSGSTASLSVPWSTCASSDVGLLSLPNPSGVDAALFTVTASTTVDKTRPSTSTPPPAGSYTGPTVPAPPAEVAPAIALYGPETLRVSKRRRVIRLVVFSSGEGQLEAQLGSTALGNRALRAGNNDLRFMLPKGFARTLAARDVLTLTSLSSSGARGATVSRKLVLTK